MKISKYKMILLSLISLTLASCGSTTDAAPLPEPANHHISAIEAADKAINAAKKKLTPNSHRKMVRKK